MGRRRQKTAPRPARKTNWIPLAAAYGVGLVFLAGGLLVLIFGKAEPGTGEDPIKGSVTRLGLGLLVLGLLAVALTGYMHWVKRRS